MPTRLRSKNRIHNYYETEQSRAWGANIFETAPVIAAPHDPAAFFYFREDFDRSVVASSLSPNGWTGTQATSGSVATDVTIPGGILKVDAGAATANQGVNLQANFAVATHATKTLFYETRFKFTGLSNLRVQAFLGLAATSTGLIASGAMATIDRIGLQGVVTNGVLQSVARSSSTGSTGTGLTLANDTWYTLGMKILTTSVEFYVNGSADPVRTATTSIPAGTVMLRPSFVCQANGTDTPVLWVDYVQIFQAR